MYATAAFQPDPTKVVGRRLFAYFIDGVLGLIVAIPFLVGIYHQNVDRTRYASAEQATAACDQFNSQYLDTGTHFTFSTGGFSSGQPFCVSAGRTTYEVNGPAVQRASRRGEFYGLLLQALNLVVLQGLTGASVGKWLLGLRVVRPDGSTARIGACAIRWLMLFVDSWCFLIGLLTMTNSKGHRRVGDMVAGTYVVARRSVGSPIIIPGVPHPSAAEPQMAAPFGAPLTGPPAGSPIPPNPAPGGWPSAPTAVQAPTGSGPTHQNDGPHWDQARNTYIRYDRTASAWLMWDAIGNAWVPISQ